MRHLLFLSLLFAALLSAAASVRAEEPFPAQWTSDILKNVPELGDPSKMMETWLNAQAFEALDRAAARRAALTTPEAVAAYQEEMKAFFIRQLGGFPERTPLNPQITGKGEGNGFRYEKIIFESRPKFFVTALLFLPPDPGPHPAVLVPCGHSANGKAYENYQRLCIGFARNGMAALIYDPVDQGERGQLLTPDGKTAHPGTTGHMLAGTGCILLGSNLAQVRVWDGMRALDYLESREDIDRTRLGCCGNSGGGTLSSYLMALDDRIYCAAPACYLTSMKRLLETIGPQDAEQNLFGQAAFGMDHADYLCMRAPRPTLMCCATKDFFDIQGSWDTCRSAKRVFGNLGFPERLDLVEADEEHGYTPLLRQTTIRWMRRWLLGKDDPVVEGAFDVLTEEETHCAPGGQALNLEGARSVYDLNRDQLEICKKGWRKPEAAELSALVGAAAPADISAAPLWEEEAGTWAGCAVRRLVLQPEPGVFLPAVRITPASVTGGCHVVAFREGKTKALEDAAALRARVERGEDLLLVDLRDTGETFSVSAHKPWDEPFGGNWQTFFRAYLLGRSQTGMWASDLVCCANYLTGGREGEACRITATEGFVIAAHCAAALAPGRIAGVDAQAPPRTWEETVLSGGTEYPDLSTVVHGMLSVCDWPALARP